MPDPADDLLGLLQLRDGCAMDYEALAALLRSRRSVRRFLDRPVPRAALERIIDAARWAPSNHNRQGWRFIVFDGRDTIRRLAARIRKGLVEKIRMSSDPRAVGEDLVEHASWFGEAPCLAIVIHKRPPAAGAGLLAGLPDPALVSGEPLSAAMAVENALLAAHAMGLGSCVLTAPLLVPEALEGIGDLPAGFVPTCLIALGYPAEDPPPPRRKEIRHLVEFRGEP